MMSLDWNIRVFPLCAGILLSVFHLTGCSLPSYPLSEITQDSSKDEVVALYGEPDRTQVFILSDAPFFGLQESLINLVSCGTTIEEWVYEIGDEELYIWFTGDGDEPHEDWRVLDLGRYPKGAVY
jgi:hypothetical protein